jgi:hypothetical protein
MRNLIALLFVLVAACGAPGLAGCELAGVPCCNSDRDLPSPANVCLDASGAPRRTAAGAICYGATSAAVPGDECELAGASGCGFFERVDGGVPAVCFPDCSLCR